MPTIDTGTRTDQYMYGSSLTPMVIRSVHPLLKILDRTETEIFACLGERQNPVPSMYLD